MNQKPKKSDWKTFSKMVPEWRERYLRAQNEELVALLENDDRSPTEQFWDAEGQVKEIAKTLRACLDGHSRSKMLMFLQMMIGSDMLTTDDFSIFSEELCEDLTAWAKHIE